MSRPSACSPMTLKKQVISSLRTEQHKLICIYLYVCIYIYMKYVHISKQVYIHTYIYIYIYRYAHVDALRRTSCLFDGFNVIPAGQVSEATKHVKYLQQAKARAQ